VKINRRRVVRKPGDNWIAADVIPWRIYARVRMRSH